MGERDPLIDVAKGIVAYAFRNGPIEDVHAGKRCPTCGDSDEYSPNITQSEMREIMRHAVDRVYAALWLPIGDWHELERYAYFYAREWDDPRPLKHLDLSDGAKAFMPDLPYVLAETEGA